MKQILNEREAYINDLTRVLKKYGQVTLNQAQAILNATPDLTMAIFKVMINKKIAIYDSKQMALIINGPKKKAYDKVIGHSMELLTSLMKVNSNISFWDTINESNEAPLTICIPTEENVYDIVYVPKGRENIVNTKMNKEYPNGEYLVIVENRGQKEELKFKGINAVYVIENGEVQNVG